MRSRDAPSPPNMGHQGFQERSRKRGIPESGPTRVRNIAPKEEFEDDHTLVSFAQGGGIRAGAQKKWRPVG